MMTASHDLDDFKTEEESSANSIRYRKISAIRRTLWWLGLLLLSPAPAAFITEDGVYLFFRSFPCQIHVESTADPQLLPTLIEKRIVITLSWISLLDHVRSFESIFSAVRRFVTEATFQTNLETNIYNDNLVHFSIYF